jgi:hypothetical protein
VKEGENLAEVQSEVEKLFRFDGPMSTVAVEVDAGSAERSRRIGEEAAEQLLAERIRVVGDGPRLRATFSLSAASDTLEIGWQEVTTPRVSVAWTYLDEEGNAQWTESYGVSWEAEHSKFRKGVPDHTRGGEIIYRFEFPNNPRQDMFEEVMSNPWEVPDAAIDRLKPPRYVPELPECPVAIRLVAKTGQQRQSQAESGGALRP